MQPNYTELAKRQQQDYQRSRNPFEYGQQVAQRRYSEILSNLDARQRETQQSYGDMYQAARQRAVGAQAMGGPTLSGGMGQQRRDFVSAVEMQELGKIGGARARAEADLYAQGQAAFSNAQLEGQQATQMELQNRTAELQLVQQRQAILNDPKLNEKQKQEQLTALEGGSLARETQQQTQSSPVNLAEAGVIAAGIGIPATAVSAAAVKAGSTAAGLSKLAGKAGFLKLTAKGGGGAMVKASSDAAAVVKAAGVSKGLGANFMLGIKSWAVKLGLAKGVVTGTSVTVAKGASAAAVAAAKTGVAKAGLALTGLGPVGWGILAIGAGALAIAGISALANR